MPLVCFLYYQTFWKFFYKLSVWSVLVQFFTFLSRFFPPLQGVSAKCIKCLFHGLIFSTYNPEGYSESCQTSKMALREKCPKMEFFLTCIFPHLTVFRSNAGKYGPEKTPYLDTFRTVWSILNVGQGSEYTNAYDLKRCKSDTFGLFYIISYLQIITD